MASYILTFIIGYFVGSSVVIFLNSYEATKKKIEKDEE